MLLDIPLNQKPDIHLTKSDSEKLRNIAFASLSTPDIVDDLLDELDRVRTVVDSEAEKYIGIGSTASYVTSEGDERTVQLVLPIDANIMVGRISILTPVGVALLGLSEGQSIDWRTRDGRLISLTIQKVHKVQSLSSVQA